MRTHILVLALLLAVAPPDGAIAREAAKTAAESEASFLLIDDFSDSDLITADLGAWLAISDKDQGGTGVATVSVEKEEAEANDAARLTFALGDRFVKKDGSVEGPRAHLGLLTGAKYGELKDLSHSSGLRFRARARTISTAGFMVISLAPGKAAIWTASFPVTEEWATIDLLWKDCKGAEPGVLEPTAVTLLAFGTAGDAEAGTKGELWLDDLGFLERSQKEIDRERAATKEYHFQGLDFEAPVLGWEWNGKKLSAAARGAELEFDAYLIDGYSRVPFDNGITADPGNALELADAYVQAVEILGLHVVERSKLERVKIDRKRSHRFGFTAELSAALAKTAPLLGGRAYVEIVYLKEAGRTYQMKCLMPADKKDELLPVFRQLISTVRPK